MDAVDVTAMLHGGHIPFVLKPRAGYYQLVGECYLHGMMDGEALEMCRDGSVEETMFKLR
jgi:hypothetical protein